MVKDWGKRDRGSPFCHISVKGKQEEGMKERVLQIYIRSKIKGEKWADLSSGRRLGFILQIIIKKKVVLVCDGGKMAVRMWDS